MALEASLAALGYGAYAGPVASFVAGYQAVNTAYDYYTSASKLYSQWFPGSKGNVVAPKAESRSGGTRRKWRPQRTSGARYRPGRRYRRGR